MASFADILVAVDTGPTTATRLDVALALAQRHDAHVTGLHALRPIAVPGYIAAQIPDSAQQIRDAADRSTVAAAKSAFDSAIARSGFPSDRTEWRSVKSDPTRAVAEHGRYADLLVIGQTDPDRSNPLDQPEPDELIVGGGRPVLMVPHSYRPDGPVGRHVLLAWNGSREAARAVSDAMPLLVGATKVSILSVNPPGLVDRDPGADIALHLSRHGVKAEAAHILDHELDPSDVLLNRAVDLGCDVMVMGGYGTPRLREMVLGGVTRDILRHMTLPVLMSH